MGAQLQKMATFLIGGAKTLWGWVMSLVTGAYNAIDQSLYLHHGRWALLILIVVILLLLMLVFHFVWKPTPQPRAGQTINIKQEIKLTPKPYRLLLVCVVFGMIYLAACFAAMD